MNLQCLGALPVSARDSRGMLLMNLMKHGLVRDTKMMCLSYKMKLEGSALAATCPGLSRDCLRGSGWERTFLDRVALMTDRQFVLREVNIPFHCSRFCTGFFAKIKFPITNETKFVLHL